MYSLNDDLKISHSPKKIKKPLIIEQSFWTMAITYYNDEWYILGVSSWKWEKKTFSFPKWRWQIINSFIETIEESTSRELLQEAWIRLDVLKKIGAILYSWDPISFNINQEFEKEYSNKTVNLIPRIINFWYKSTSELIEWVNHYDEADKKERVVKLINIKYIDKYFKHKNQINAFYDFREKLFFKNKYWNWENLEKEIKVFFNNYKKRYEELMERKKSKN